MNWNPPRHDGSMVEFLRLSFRPAVVGCLTILLAAVSMQALSSSQAAGDGSESEPSSFDEDIEFLARHTEVLILGKSPQGARLAVVPQWQGRVMTSTCGGEREAGHGWINRKLIASGKLQPQINAFGGEDRFWLGPEGGQFSVFFKQGDPFDLEHWQTPAAIDSEPYIVTKHGETFVELRHAAKLTNHTGTVFEILIQRRIELIAAGEAASQLGVHPSSDMRMVAYRSLNRITNRGATKWTADRGLLSIWILGMFKHSPTSTVVIPLREGPEETLGPLVNDVYFGKVPADRLRAEPSAVFFRADGRHRSKIGVGPRRARGVLGSYDSSRSLLTIVSCNQPDGALDYVDSTWRMQDEPYRGDVLNAYNDGPPAPDRKPLGPFYELETSSPAVALAPGESLLHEHRTYHLEGPGRALNPVARAALGVGIERIEQVF